MANIAEQINPAALNPAPLAAEPARATFRDYDKPGIDRVQIGRAHV